MRTKTCPNVIKMDPIFHVRFFRAGNFEKLAVAGLLADVWGNGPELYGPAVDGTGAGADSRRIQPE